MIEQLYRSAVKPDPIWTETALYGGYTHIDMGYGVWLSREQEYLFRAAISEEPEREFALQKLKLGMKTFRPSRFQVSNYCKIVRLIQTFKIFSVIGMSEGLKDIICSTMHKTIYTDRDYGIPGGVVMSAEDIARSSSHVVTIINSSCMHLKEHITNWGNIVIYTESMLHDYDEQIYLDGGVSNEPKLETTTKAAE